MTQGKIPYQLSCVTAPHRKAHALALDLTAEGHWNIGGFLVGPYWPAMFRNVDSVNNKVSRPIWRYFLRDGRMSAIVFDCRAGVGYLEADVFAAPNTPERI
jgi:hypothetical protein